MFHVEHICCIGKVFSIQHPLQGDRADVYKRQEIESAMLNLCRMHGILSLEESK